MRRAFSILFSLSILLIVSGILTIAMKYARVSAEYTIGSYTNEQARLLLRSAIERVLLDISRHDRGSNINSLDCLKSADYSWSIARGVEYKAHIDIKRYYLKEGRCSNVDTINISSEKSHGMVLIEAEMNATIDGQLKQRVIYRGLQHP